jgi:UDP-glucose 4-epimerase
MNIFLTGGAGYIGSTAIRMLLKEGHQVTAFDSLITGHRLAVPSEAKFIEGDLADREALIQSLSKGEYQAVMHFAAFIEAGESMHDPGKYFRNNVANTQNLLDACIHSGVGKFVFSSTAAVYASSDESLSETSSIDPPNVYGQTKLMIEQMLKWYSNIHGLRYAALRYFNAAGAIPGCGEAHRPESHLIPLVLQVPLGLRDAVSIYGTDGGEGSDTARSGTSHPIPAEETPRRPGDPPRLVASSEKIRSELGWDPQYPELTEIIASAWEWHRKYPHGYE